MAQFKVYYSSDVSAPVLTGAAGTLIGVLDACLVNGYGAKTAAGWTQPVATASNIASYLQGAGAGFGFILNDNGPNATSTYKEAWATGWETIAGVGSPVGSGTGQFPTAAQLLTSGHVVIRKSVAVDATSRPWIVFADDRTVYIFIQTGDTAGTYCSFGFGDIYSYGGSGDLYRCIIMGRNNENSAAVANEGFEIFNVFNTATIGNYMARPYGGAGASLQVGKHGDATKGSASYYLGTCVYPNASDASAYLSPVFVCEPGGPSIRGRLRGLYQPLHAVSAFVDGGTFNGTGEYTGKTFQAVKLSRNSGVFIVETSNTLDTN